jgi:cholesterol transport system auxiliary component
MNHPLPPRSPDSEHLGQRRAALKWLLAAGLTLQAACSGTLLPRPAQPPARFTLEGNAPATAPRAASADAPVLTVDIPRAAPGYDSRHMLYLRRPQELEAFAFHEWLGPPAQMLAPLLVRALQDSTGLGAVLLAPSAAASRWRLETELLRLHQDFTRQPSQVRMSLRAVLLDSASGQALAWQEFDVSVAAAGDDPVAGAAGAQAAARQLVAAVAAFCSAQLGDASMHQH